MKHILWTPVFVATCLAALAGQDVVRLKNGATLEGRIIAESESKITLRIADGTVDLAKETVSKVTRVSRNAEREEQRALMTLSRFSNRDTWHMLYRRGKRVGYRHMTVRRDLRDGIPGYSMEDRIVFLTDPGQGPEAERTIREFVDAELRPLHVSCRRVSGISGWLLDATRKGERLEIVERIAGHTRRRTALFRRGAEVWGMLLLRLASEPVPDGGYPVITLFDPSQVCFRNIGLERRLERVTVRGRATDVLVFKRSVGDKSLETWVDMAGNVVREEINSPYLVSLRAPRKEVLAYVRGETDVGAADLFLEFRCEETGLRILRPDTAWDMEVPNRRGGRLVSFLRPGMRATVDVFRVTGFPAGSTAEGIALDLFGRMQAESKGCKTEGPYEGLVGDMQGLWFKVKSRRRKEEITTLGALVMDRDQAFIILCAAPTRNYSSAESAFKEVLDSVRIIRPDESPEEQLEPEEEIPETKSSKSVAAGGS